MARPTKSGQVSVKVRKLTKQQINEFIDFVEEKIEEMDIENIAEVEIETSTFSRNDES